MTSPLTALANLISSSVQTLESAYSKEGLAFPSLDEPFRPGPLDNDAAIMAATHVIIAAAHQLIATVRSPMDTIFDYAPSMFMSASLGLAVDVDVPDVLKDAGPQGLHVKEIGEKVDIEGEKLARILRYLATRHVFKEVAPDVFANNRVSSILIKTRPLEDLKSDHGKLTKYDDSGIPAMVGHMTDDGLRASAYITTYLKGNPKDSESPFNLGWNTKQSIWEWFEEPGNEWRGRRFVSAMTGGAALFPSTIFTDGFDWKALKEGSVVVDVGGNVGTVTLTIAKSFPHLKYIVEDQEKVISTSAHKFWEEQSPESLTSGQVSLKVQNFFEPQAVKNAAVYFMRMVLHDWPNSKCIEILKAIRAAAGPTSKLVVFDIIMPYACPDPAGLPPPPFPLLANLGLPVGGFLTAVDLQMLNLVNGQERTLSQFVELGKATGWKLEGVKPGVLAALEFSAV
ncbi:S-adenosyl-L-methionine-dependent methyltransferase [Artomyces pyxidatus]|uniref:S-adenosyl-L-methionine-dependent methyltransferase n=1 Tax=Artomyces pyxidatus TaxID=48021 RepID=A0ACB8SP35_9AGAM|nr:S-adenosyl-L-methionine-dependent methyltransferase [Artomyces pyxidatus]